MPMDTIEHLTTLLMTPELRARLIELESLAPGMGFALRVTVCGSKPVLFANEAMPVRPDSTVPGAETLANLSNVELATEMSILIYPGGDAVEDNRGELILGALQVLDLLDKEISVQVAA